MVVVLGEGGFYRGAFLFLFRGLRWGLVWVGFLLVVLVELKVRLEVDSTCVRFQAKT